MTTKDIIEEGIEEFDRTCEHVGMGDGWLMENPYRRDAREQIIGFIKTFAQKIQKAERERIKDIADDWFSKAPKYRTKENLIKSLTQEDHE